MSSVTVSARSTRARFVGLGALALLVVAAAIWFMSARTDSGAPTPAQAGLPAPVSVPTTTATVAAAHSGRVDTWTVPEALVGLRGITVGPDGRVWVTEQNRGQVASLLGDQLTRYRVSKLFETAGSFSFGWGPDEALWFTGYPGGTLGRVLPDGKVNLFEARGVGATTLGVAAAPDGSMWATDPNLGALTRISTDGTVTPVLVSTDGGQTGRPAFIVLGTDGNMWFTIPDTSEVAKVSTDGTFTVTRYAVPGHVVPRSIVSDGNGSLWVTLEDRPALARVDEASGEVVIVPLRGKAPTDGLNGIALAADGTLWVTTPSNVVLQVATDGSILRRTAIPGAPYADGVVVAPSGDVWVAARDDLIAKISP